MALRHLDTEQTLAPKISDEVSSVHGMEHAPGIASTGL